jgi:hypothetical protein
MDDMKVISYLSGFYNIIHRFIHLNHFPAAIPNLAIKPDGFPKYRQFSLIFKSATSLLAKIIPKPVRFVFEFGIAGQVVINLNWCYHNVSNPRGLSRILGERPQRFLKPLRSA